MDFLLSARTRMLDCLQRFQFVKWLLKQHLRQASNPRRPPLPVREIQYLRVGLILRKYLLLPHLPLVNREQLRNPQVRQEGNSLPLRNPRRIRALRLRLRERRRRRKWGMTMRICACWAK